MSKISDSKWNVFADGQVSDADKVSDNIYNPDASHDSLEAINGHLDRDNIATSSSLAPFQITSDLVQKNTFTGSGMIGSTGNVDFFQVPHFFNKYRYVVLGPDAPKLPDGTPNVNNSPAGQDMDVPVDSDFVPIPGANISFYLPYDCTLVLFTWNAHFDDDGSHGIYGNGGEYDGGVLSLGGSKTWDTTGTYGLKSDGFFEVAGQPVAAVPGMNKYAELTRTYLRFYIDDQWVEGQERFTNPMKQRPSRADTFGAAPGEYVFMPGGSIEQGRYWNGHHAANANNNSELSKGWHSAGLRIFSNSNQARVRVRSIRYVFFR
jgi:hypothetical protein